MLGNDDVAFEEKHEYELDRLADGELIAYVVAAREAGNLQAARAALGVFAARRFDDLVRRALVRMGSREDAEDVAAQAIHGILEAAFKGELVGEAVVFLHRILQRRIADFYRSRRQTEQLPEDSDDEDGIRRDAAVTGDDKGIVELEQVVERIYARLSPEHCRVVDDYVFDGYDAAETAARVNNSFPGLDPPMSDQNVHQIASRFRKDLRRDLEGS